MELTGIVYKILGKTREGVSQRTGKRWYMAQFVLAHGTQEHTKYVCFEVMSTEDDSTFRQMDLHEGEAVKVLFDVDARDYTKQDGTVAWMNSIRAYNIDRDGVLAVERKQATATPLQPTYVRGQAQPSVAAGGRSVLNGGQGVQQVQPSMTTQKVAQQLQAQGFTPSDGGDLPF